MNRRIITYIVVFTMLITAFTTGFGFAATSGELQQQKQKIEQEKQAAAKKLQEGKAKEKELGSQIGSIQSKISATEGDIQKLQDNIKQTQESINKVQVELQKVQAEMDIQNDNLNQRLRAMYMKNNASFLEILLGSESIVEFMSNMDIIELIYESDVELLKTIETQHNKIESQKKNLQNLQSQLEASKAEEAARKEALIGDKNQVEALKQQVSVENAAEARNLAALAAEADNITSQIQALMNPNVQYTGGQLGWPLPGSPSSYRITSEFSGRVNPITGRSEKHLGMDIAAKSGTTVLAANGGTVIKAEYNRSYGYMVIIDHGGGIATLYAHNSRLGVKVGQQVTKGQTISYVGSTGASTGPHLHLEVRKNGQYTNPRGWLGI